MSILSSSKFVNTLAAIALSEEQPESLMITLFNRGQPLKTGLDVLRYVVGVNEIYLQAQVSRSADVLPHLAILSYAMSSAAIAAERGVSTVVCDVAAPPTMPEAKALVEQAIALCNGNLSALGQPLLIVKTPVLTSSDNKVKDHAIQYLAERYESVWASLETTPNPLYLNMSTQQALEAEAIALGVDKPEGRDWAVLSQAKATAIVEELSTDG